MRVLLEYPPNIKAIVAKFPAAMDHGVIFAYGDTIYNPTRTQVTVYLRAHENAHGERQLARGVDEWWDRYLVDKFFRFDEELIGHKAEVKAIISHGRLRTLRDALIENAARRLSGPMYGAMVTYDDALRAITTP